MPLLKFLKSLGKKRKKKNKEKEKDGKEKGKEEEKKREVEETRQPSIDSHQGMIPPQIHGQAVSSPVTARLGESLTLVVSVKGVPPPTIKWFCGTKEIKPCKEFRMKDDGLQYTLHIPKVTESLGKKGICISARNRLGEIKRRVDLKVYKVYSSRRHYAVSDSETAKSPDSIVFRKKRKLKLIRPKSSPSLVSDSEDEGGRIAYISTDSVVDDVVYETIRSSARHIEPPRLRPRKPAIYTDSSLYETYADYRIDSSRVQTAKNSKDEINGVDDVDGAIGGAEQSTDAEMLNPRCWVADPDYATIEDIRRRRQSPAADRRALTWRGVKSPTRTNELDSRRVHDDDDDITYRSLQYDIHNDDGSSDSRHPASTASENPYGSLHIASETPYGSLHGNSERNYGILKPPRTTKRPTQDDHLKTESDAFDGYADISEDCSPYSTATRPVNKCLTEATLPAGERLQKPAVNGHSHPRENAHEAVNHLWEAQAESARNYSSLPNAPSQTLPKMPYQDDYCGYMGRQQGLHPFFADDIENKYSYLPGMDIRNNPHAKSSDYDFSDHGYGTLRSTATDYDSLTRRSPTRPSQNEYLTYGQARQAMRSNSLGRRYYWSPVGGPYGKTQTGRESGYESGYLSGLANSESHYGIITFPPRRDVTDNTSQSHYAVNTLPSRRTQSESPYSTRAVPAPVRSINTQGPQCPHSERFFYRESFRSPASSPMSSPRIGRSPSRVKQTTEILTMVKKVSPVRAKSLDRDSPTRSLPDVLASQSPRVQSVVGTNFAEPITTRLTDGFDVTDSRLFQAAPDRVSAVSQPSDGPVLSPPVMRRPPIPMSTTIIRSKSAGPGVRYSNLRNRSPSPVRRSTQIRTYDITPTPSRATAAIVTSLSAGKAANSSSVKTPTASVSSRIPSPPSYLSATSSVPLKPAPVTRYEKETTPKVTSTIETVTETETIYIPTKVLSTSTTLATSQPSQTSSSASLKNAKAAATSGTKTVTETTIDGGNTSIKSTYMSPGTSSSTTTDTETVNPEKVASKGRVRVIEEKCLTETESKFEFNAGKMSEIFQGISNTLQAAIDGTSADSTDLSSNGTANSPSLNASPSNGSPLHNLTSVMNEYTASNGAFPTLDQTFLNTMRSTFGDPERLMTSLPENLQAILRSASCQGQNGHVEATGTATTTTSSTEKDSDKDTQESLSKIGKAECTNPDLVVKDANNSTDTLTLVNQTNCLGIMDTGNCQTDTFQPSGVLTETYYDAEEVSETEQTNHAGGSNNFDSSAADTSSGIEIPRDKEPGKMSEVGVMSESDMCSRDKFLQDVNNKTEVGVESQNSKPKEESEFELDDDVFEDQVTDDAEVSLALSRSAAAFNSIEKGALEGILDLSIVNDILQFSDITSEDVLDDDEIEELSQLIIANISDDVRKEIEKDITIKDYVKSVISQACANLQANTNDSYRVSPGNGSHTPEHLEGTFYEMEIIEDDEDEKLGQVSPRFLLPPRYDVDCESDQLSAITEEDDEEMLKVEDIPKDDDTKPEDFEQINNNTDNTDKTGGHDVASPAAFMAGDIPDNAVQESGAHCIAGYEDDMIINTDDVANGNDVTCVYQVSSKFKCVVENYEDKVENGGDECVTNQPVTLSNDGCEETKSSSKSSIASDSQENDVQAKNVTQKKASATDKHGVYYVMQNIKEITTTYDIQLVPIPIENKDKSSNGASVSDKGKTTMKYPEHGIDLEIEVCNQPPDSKPQHPSRIYHHDYKTHAQANGIQERLSLMHDEYSSFTDDYGGCHDDDDDDYDDEDDDDDDEEDTDDEAGMEYDLNDICNVLDFCGDPEFKEALEECLNEPPYGDESPLDTPSDSYCLNGTEDEDLDPSNQFKYADDHTLHDEDDTADDGENDAQTLSIDSGMDSRASMITSLASKNSERKSSESSSDSNMISKDISTVSECWTTSVTKVQNPSDCYVCDIIPGESATVQSGSVLSSIVTCLSERDQPTGDLDGNIVCSKEQPILKPITRMVAEVGDTRVSACDNALGVRKGLKRKIGDEDTEFYEYIDVPKEAPILKPITRMMKDIHETRIDSGNVVVSKQLTSHTFKVTNDFDDHIDCPKEAPILKPITKMVEDVHETRIGTHKSNDHSVNVGSDFVNSQSNDEGFDKNMDWPAEDPILKPITRVMEKIHEPRVREVNKSLDVIKCHNSELVMEECEFDSHIDIPMEPPILKPITKIVDNIDETRIVHSASEKQAVGASKNQARSFVMLKNLFRIHVPKEVLSTEEKLRFAATINQSDVSVSSSNGDVVIRDTGKKSVDVTCDDMSNDEDDADDSMNDTFADDVVNMLDDPSVMADITEAVQAESSSSDAHLVEAVCGENDHQGDEEMRVIWHAHGLWDELKRNAGSFMLLLIAVILMQIVNHWLSVEGREDD